LGFKYKKPVIILHLGKPNDNILKETISLAETAGYYVLKVFTQARSRPDSRYYLGRGKIGEVKKYINELDEDIRKNVKIIVNGRTKPNQLYNIMRELNVEAIDRVLLILEIFNLHAGSKEAKLQIELATLSYQLPLLKEWVRLSKLGELPGFLSSGGYKIDSYYYMVRRRISKIKKELEWVRERRKILRDRRRIIGLPLIVITGYTSAGKTTLFNTLTGSCKPIGSEPFTTLSPKAKGVEINGLKTIISDTVGFIDKVPIEIIEAFYSTLEEIVDADLILLIVDISEGEGEILRKIKGSIKVLEDIGGLDVPLIVIANKIDLIKDEDEIKHKVSKLSEYLKSTIKRTIPIVSISACKGCNLEALKDEILKVLHPKWVDLEFILPKAKLDELKIPYYSIVGVNGQYVRCKSRIPTGDIGYVRSLIEKCKGRLLTES